MSLADFLGRELVSSLAGLDSKQLFGAWVGGNPSEARKRTRFNGGFYREDHVHPHQEYCQDVYKRQAMWRVSPEMIRQSIPPGWMNPFFGWKLGLDWTGIMDSANNAIRHDGNEFFMIIFLMMTTKGVLASLAGPAPNYDMQRILATRNPREACLMSGLVNIVMWFPAYVMGTGIVVLALGFCMPELRAMSTPDFEKILPMVLSKYVPTGLLGIMLAGFMAAFMSNFSSTLNAAPAYLVNDIYKRFINPGVSGRAAVNLSRIASFVVLAMGIVLGLMTTRITDVMMWLVGALYGGFVVANVLKWYWWRFNGYGYFWGMVSGIVSSMIIPIFAKRMYGDDINMLYTFPVIFLISAASSFIGTWCTKPEDDAIPVSYTHLDVYKRQESPVHGQFYRVADPGDDAGELHASADGKGASKGQQGHQCDGWR